MSTIANNSEQMNYVSTRLILFCTCIWLKIYNEYIPLSDTKMHLLRALYHSSIWQLTLQNGVTTWERASTPDIFSDENHLDRNI